MSRTSSVHLPATPLSGTCAWPEARPPPANSATRPSSASASARQAKCVATDRTGNRCASIGPGIALIASTLPASPPSIGRASALTLTRVAGSAASHAARSRSWASSESSESATAASGASLARSANCASPARPPASTATASIVPETAMSARASFRDRSPTSANVPLTANGGRASTVIRPVSVPRGATSESLSTRWSAAPPA